MWETWVWSRTTRRSPWRRERLATPVFWPGEFHGLYYSPRGRRVGHDWVTFTFTNGHGIIPKVTKRVYIRDTNSIQNNKVSLWLTNAWNLLPREATKENRDTEETARLSQYLYQLHIHSFKQTLEDCPANNSHSFLSHFPFYLPFLLWNDFSFPLLSTKI